MNHFIVAGAVLALVLTTAAPEPVLALDVKKTVRKVTRGVSKTVGGLGGNRNNDDKGSSASSGSAAGGSSGGGGGLASASASAGRNGIKATVGSSLLGGTDVNVRLLGSGAAARANASVGNSRVGAAVLSRRQLATLRIDSNPPGTGNVVLPGGGVGGVTPSYARKLLASLDNREQQILLQRCSMITRSPKAFDAELVLLCRILAKL